MKKLLLVVTLVLMAPLVLLAQNGKLSGKITDVDTKEPIPFAVVKVSSGGIVKGNAQSDIDGNYTVSPLTPGKYDIEILVIGYSKKEIKGVVINFETTTRMPITMASSTKELNVVVVEEYKVPLIKKDETSTGRKLTAEDIAKMPTRSLGAIVNTVPGVQASDVGGALNIRGNRGGDNATFVNGVRVFGANSLPPVEAVSEVAVITGGVPAQYGDALGGIISYTTKSAPSRYFGNVQFETSRPFDQWRYDLLGISAGGPLLRSKGVLNDAGQIVDRRTLVGFFGVMQYQGNRDAGPSAYGYYKVKDNVLENLKANPVVQISDRYYSRANFFTVDSFDKVKYINNGQRHNFTTNLAFDVQPAENVLLSFGGNFNMVRARNSGNFTWFNYENNSVSTAFDYNAFIRLRQSFNDVKPGQTKIPTVKNIYYQLQFDISRNFQYTQDERHKDKLSHYNYVGKFQEQYRNDTTFGLLRFRNVDPTTGSSDTLNLVGTFDKPLVFMNSLDGWNFQGSNINPVLSNYTQSIVNQNPFYIYNGAPSLLNVFPVRNMLTDGFLFNRVGAAINGSGAPAIGYAYPDNAGAGGQFSAIGNTTSGYNRNIQQQYRISAQASAEIKKHTIKVGFEYEQRVFSSYNVTTNLWARARGLVNNQLLSQNAGLVIDTVTRTNADGRQFLEVTSRARLNTDANGNILGQTDFDRNLRTALGLPVSSATFLNVDQVDPNMMRLGLFSVSDIFNNAVNPMAAWQGYDAYGNLNTKRVAFNDFFLDTLNRPIDAFRPIYIAGYIEDKFEIEDFILRVGLRVDRFDQNTSVLKDPYSLTRLRTVGETNISEFAFNPNKPSQIGDDFAVYVNKSSQTYNGANQNTFQVTGYRDGDQWYRADGSPTQNPREIETNSGGKIEPWYDARAVQNDPTLGRLQKDNFITLDAFERFKPQTNFMPRVAFSFPISEDALFFAHYDILTQRPLTAGGGNPFGAPIQYYAMSQSGSYLASTLGPSLVNPNLNPQKKIDYQVGFQQRLSERSALKFSLFYSEIKDLIQIRRYTSAYPVTYITDGNQDFGVVKGATLAYEMRRNQNLTFDASYTLQYAETSASNFAGALLNTATPNLRATVPANYDSRHSFKLNLDYRLMRGEGPKIFGYKVFENAGINVIGNAFSGTPYTKLVPNFTGDVVTGQINGSRLPWNTRTDVRIDKSFFFGGNPASGKRPQVVNVYVYIQNFFDARNVLSVYARSGSAKDDGFLASTVAITDRANYARSGLNAETYTQYYNMLILNPDRVTLPRWVRLGASYTF